MKARCGNNAQGRFFWSVVTEIHPIFTAKLPNGSEEIEYSVLGIIRMPGVLKSLKSRTLPLSITNPCSLPLAHPSLKKSSPRSNLQWPTKWTQCCFGNSIGRKLKRLWNKCRPSQPRVRMACLHSSISPSGAPLGLMFAPLSWTACRIVRFLLI